MGNVKKLPNGAMSDAARRLGVSRQYILQIVRGERGGTDRCLEILKVVEECADARFQARRAEKNLRDELKRKYAVETPHKLAVKLTSQQAAN